MTRRWESLETEDTPDGRLELRRRAEDDFLILLDGRILMNSRANRSELALGELAARSCADGRSPRMLIGGLGMGYTLRAALDALPETAEVVVSEINEVVIRWCREALGPLTNAAIEDPRVRLEASDVALQIREAGGAGKAFDTIALDLYEGPHPNLRSRNESQFNAAALRTIHRALRPQGVLALWTEHRDPPFERRLGSAGFTLDVRRPGRGGLRHAVYLARRRR
jgi:spermidine synthase